MGEMGEVRQMVIDGRRSQAEEFKDMELKVLAVKNEAEDTATERHEKMVRHIEYELKHSERKGDEVDRKQTDQIEFYHKQSLDKLGLLNESVAKLDTQLVARTGEIEERARTLVDDLTDKVLGIEKQAAGDLEAVDRKYTTRTKSLLEYSQATGEIAAEAKRRSDRGQQQCKDVKEELSKLVTTVQSELSERMNQRDEEVEKALNSHVARTGQVEEGASAALKQASAALKSEIAPIQSRTEELERIAGLQDKLLKTVDARSSGTGTKVMLMENDVNEFRLAVTDMDKAITESSSEITETEKLVVELQADMADLAVDLSLVAIASDS
jgi:hypothetical protein